MLAPAFPNLRTLIDPILGAPYDQYPCWTLARTLMQEGLGLDTVEDPHRAAQQLSEVWYEGDPRDPLTLVQPWDLFIMLRHGLVSEHVGLVVNSTTLVHTRRTTGVVLEPLQRWVPKLLQLARLRMLEGMG